MGSTSFVLLLLYYARLYTLDVPLEMAHPRALGALFRGLRGLGVCGLGHTRQTWQDGKTAHTSFPIATNAIYKLGPDDVARATRQIVQCKEWGERGLANCAERLPRLQANDFLRFSCLKEILDAIRVVHELGYIHGDIKLENVVYFGDEAGYKLINFDNSARPGDLWAKHCTEVYSPPEMAKFMLGHTDNLIASPAFDISPLREFMAIDNEDILEEIAKPRFPFEASIQQRI
ncbi:Aste57867_12787 [Aphanomyces stellatus]|uniref:Aste57867_12787 protein n=1 Tax=Aphanomyces stellatus TaxID=120398 RepID=A0A485KWW6_9STRA|nr:hypothetical protein As57867_012739 [Aphanomyces stellatus]VFT89636.1 Aste57867_12787 [Aphanomyces stellatus]